jgi:imidazolonepropionase
MIHQIVKLKRFEYITRNSNKVNDMNEKWDAIWINGKIVTCKQGEEIKKQAGIAVYEGKIAWIGAVDDLPHAPEHLSKRVYDLNGDCLTPGFIDCHTHLVYAGNRAHEFEWRLQGMTYENIARQGGGIQSTVKATRAASQEELFEQSLVRALALVKSGVTTLEIKSGYGLDWPTELKMLRVAKEIETRLSVTVKKTFLGAHTFPPEYRANPDAYVDLVCHEMIPAIAKEKLAEAVDVFCEKIAFNLAQTERIFSAAKEYGLAIKCHAEQLSDSGCAVLSAKYQALSVDHLEHISEEGVKAISASGTVAVLLPGAFYFLRETTLPPLNLLRQYQVPLAIASDCNPGTSPIMSLLLIMNMACTIFKMTPEEALAGVTRIAAKALGLEKTHGVLALGMAADFAIWDVSHPVELVYYLGGNPLKQLVKNGELLSI